jgi:hypothetical protein
VIYACAAQSYQLTLKKFILSRNGEEYKISLLKFGGPPISIGIENVCPLDWKIILTKVFESA